MFKPRSLFPKLAGRTRLALLTTVVALVAIAFPGSASASNFGGCVDFGGTINVNTTTDEAGTGANCALREAITGANDPSNVGARTINVPAGTYQLTISATDDTNAGGDLDITRAMTITGAGARTTFIQAGTTLANGIDRVFDIRATGNLSLNGATVRFGRVAAAGGGLRLITGGTLAITDSAVSSNTVTGNNSDGGGIHSDNNLTLTRVLVNDNHADQNGSTGAGIFINNGTANLTNVTVTGNTANGNSGSVGAGIQADGGTFNLTNATIASNTSTGTISGINRTGGLTNSLRNTIVANNSGSNCSTGITNTSDNLDSGTTCGFTTANGSQSSTNPLLGSLTNNGGPTDTMALQTTPSLSPAIDSGNAAPPAPTNDQRSALRDAVPDVGAYEACGPSPTVSHPGNQSVTYGASASFTAAASGRPTVQWEVSTNGGGVYTDVPGATSATLSFSRPTVSQSGNLYRAKFTGTGCTGTVTTNAATLTVAAKNLTISGAVANNKTYDANNTATINFGSATLNGVESGDTVTINSSGMTATFNSKNVGQDRPVTVTGVALSGAEAGNYTVSQPTGLDADIIARIVTISGAVAGDKDYDATDGAEVNFTSATLNNRAPTENATHVDFDASGYSATFDDKNVGDDKPVTVTNVTLEGTESGNYQLTQPTGLTADIDPRQVTIDGAVGDDRDYDGTDVATVDFSGASLQNRAATEDSDDVDFDETVTPYSATFDGPNGKDVGDDKPITVEDVVLVGTEASNYELTQPTGLTADIDPRTVTISGAVADNKVYDGTDGATVDFTGASLQNRASGEDADDVDFDETVTPYSATFDGPNGKDVGDDKPITVTDVELVGTEASNYELTQPAGLTADITKRNVAFIPPPSPDSPDAQDKTYDGTDEATVDFTGAVLQNRAAGEDASDVDFDAATYDATFDGPGGKDVGDDKGVTVTGVTVQGTEAGNYTISQPTGLTADINQRVVTIDGAVGDDKDYDGTDGATVDFTGASLQNRASGEDADDVDFDETVTPYSATFDGPNGKDVGDDKPITVTDVELVGTEASNYELTQPTGLTADIDPRTVTISGAVGDDRDYDGTDVATVDFTSASLQNRASGEDADDVDFDETVTPYSATFDGPNGKNVDVNKPITVTDVELTGTEASNYELTQPTGLTADITARPVTIDGATADDRDYNGTNVATVNFGAATLQNRAATDDASDVDFDETEYNATFANKNVGTAKPVTVTEVVLTGTEMSNYVLTQPTGLTATVSTLDTDGSFVANDKVYDGTTAATTSTRTLTAEVAGDDVDLAGAATFATKNVENGKTVTIATPSLSGVDAPNYNLENTSTDTADITAKSVTGGMTAADKAYDGTTAATVTNRSLTGAVAGDTVSLSGGTATFANENVGNGKTVTLSGASLAGTDAPNYTLAPGAITDTANITAKSVTGSFAAADKVYDGNAGATVNSRSLSGAVSGDSVSLSGGTASFANENVGTGKTVTLSGASLAGSDAGNYTLGSVGTDTANITARSVTGSFTAANKVADGTTAATITGRSLAGQVAGDAVALTGGTATFSDANPGVNKPVTGTGFTLGGADAGNYTLASVGGTTATITQRGPAEQTPPTKEELEAAAANKLGGDVKSLGGFSLNGLGFAFAPADQGKAIKATNQPLFAIGCVAPCSVEAGKTLVLTGEAGASAAATKKLKLKTQKMSLDTGEIGVIKLKLSKKQKKAIKKAKKAKLVVKVTVVSGGETVTDKKTYRLKAKNG